MGAHRDTWSGDRRQWQRSIREQRGTKSVQFSRPASNKSELAIPVQEVDHHTVHRSVTVCVAAVGAGPVGLASGARVLLSCRVGPPDGRDFWPMEPDLDPGASNPGSGVLELQI